MHNIMENLFVNLCRLLKLLSVLIVKYYVLVFSKVSLWYKICLRKFWFIGNKKIYSADNHMISISSWEFVSYLF